VIGDTYERGGLLLVPARLALALQADGWVLRSEIVWRKPNRVPGWGGDRPVSSTERVLLLTRRRRGYFYDAEVMREPAEWAHWGRQTAQRVNGGGGWQSHDPDRRTVLAATKSRQGRDVWTIPTERAFPGAMPLELAERCIRAGCPEGGTVLDPFAGTGTTLLAAARLGRTAIGIEASAEMARVAEQRL
jgi:DNA modification methylase